MENMHKNKKHKFHMNLAHSYFVYFILFILGVFLNLFLKIDLFIHSQICYFIGILLILFSTFIIFWAQKSSDKMSKQKEINKKSFCLGPYCYTKEPTHYGIFFLMLGFGFIMESLFIVIFTIISFFITKYFFLKKHHLFLEEKHGEHYKEYKKNIHF